MHIAFSNPAYLLFLLLLVPVTLCYIYLTRHTTRIVPSLEIWQSARDSNPPLIQHSLRRFLEWLFACLVLSGLVLLASGPHVPATTPDRPLIFLLDNSSSMLRRGANSSNRSLLEQAKTRIQQELNRLSPEFRWRIYHLAPAPRLLERGTGPPDQDVTAPDEAPLKAGQKRLDQFISSIADTPDTSSPSPPVYCYTDQQIQNLSSLLKTHKQLRIVPIGGPEPNTAITRATLKRKRTDTPIISVRITNYSASPNNVPLLLHGVTKDTIHREIPPESSRNVRLPVRHEKKKQNRVGIVLDFDDPFTLDNAAYFTDRTQPVPVRVEMSSGAVPYVRSAIRATGPPFVIANDADDSETSSSSSRQSIIITDDPPEERGTFSGIFFRSTRTSSNSVQTEKPPDIHSDQLSSITEGLAFDEFQVKTFHPFTPGSDETCFLSTNEGCLAVLGTPEDTAPYVQFGFELSQTNLVVLPEFPLLLQRLLRRLTGRPDLTSKLAVTERLKSNQTADTYIREWLRRDGSISLEHVSNITPQPLSLRPGWYRAAGSKKSEVKAVNFIHPKESRMNRTSSIVNQRSVKPANFQVSTGDNSFPLQELILFLTVFCWGVFLCIASI